MSAKQAIIEYLIQHQAEFKTDVQKWRNQKKDWLKQVNPIYRFDLEEQYEARIKQHIAFITSFALGLPSEYVIIELENIELEEYLNV